MPTVSPSDVSALETMLQTLKRDYERFFLGLERHPPEEDRIAFRRQLRRLSESTNHNTQLKYRIANAQASFGSHEGLWDRQLAQREGWVPPKHSAVVPSTASAPEDSAPKTPAVEALPPPVEPSTQATTVAPAAAPAASLIDRLWRVVNQQYAAFDLDRNAFEADVTTKIRAAEQQFGHQGVTVQLVVEGGRPTVRVVPKK